MVETRAGTRFNDVIKATKSGIWPIQWWESWRIYGLQGDDVLIGGPKNDLLDGGPGRDKMDGGKGNDTYVVDSYWDQVVEYSGQGYDHVQSYVSYALPNNVEWLELLGNASNGYGNSLDNYMVGNSNHNSLFGYAGRDTLRGLGGDDVLVGGLGEDFMYGNQGNDTYYVDNPKDIVREYDDINRRFEGTDTVISTVNYTLPNYVENLRLSGNAQWGSGNKLNNRIEGNARSNTLGGREGSDYLLGHNGNDRLVGGGYFSRVEFDVLEGGRGADTFVIGDSDFSPVLGDGGVFYRGNGHAIINDFNRFEGDKFEFGGYASNYTLGTGNYGGSSALDTAIYHKRDLIAIAQDVTLSWSDFAGIS